ncbi:MAG: putative baseplate assembly protein [Propionivibrio sp.]|nr:putative baseplate assembly protein [Propionivibrio sp.]
MPIQLPNLDDRTYRQLVDEMLARVPVHTPEWTQFGEADPGVTLLELFAFLGENLLYRANQIPERNRLKFLQLLNLPLRPATPARALVTLANTRGPLTAQTLSAGLVLKAGQIPFQTDRGLEVLPLEGQAFFKRPLENPDAAILTAYRDLFRSYYPDRADAPITLYETVALDPNTGMTLAANRLDGVLWIALLRRASDKTVALADVRAALAGRTLSLGLWPDTRNSSTSTTSSRTLLPGNYLERSEDLALDFHLPAADASGKLLALDARLSGDLKRGAAYAEVTLPGKEALVYPDTLDPLEAGVGDLPPSLEDTDLAPRLITWLRISPRQSAGSGVRLLWAGAHALPAVQVQAIHGETLGRGSGARDQTVRLSRTPVVAGSVKLTSTGIDGAQAWQEIDDLYAAPPELVGGATARVFRLDPESGEIRFGDGLRGARPPYNTELRADYRICQGAKGNVTAHAINAGAGLPPGFTVDNPVAAWGGSDAESAADGEKRITHHLRHRDRLVTAEDYRDLTARTPGIDVARVDVLPAYKPDMGASAAGDVPGAVTLMVLPKHDGLNPEAPQPDRAFLDAICAWLQPRRLITTELIVTGPRYRDLWLSVGLRPNPDMAFAEAAQRVKDALAAFLSPLPDDASQPDPGQLEDITPGGWPLNTPVIRLQLWAVASRVPGVMLINDLKLALDDVVLKNAEEISCTGLQLPRIVGIDVREGLAAELDLVRRRQQGEPIATPGGGAPLPVPVIPDCCR